MTAKVLVSDRLHIPVKVVDADNIIRKMTHYEFDNAACKNCEFRSIRPSEECRQCSKGGLVDITVLAKYSEIKGKRYVSVPYGEMHRFTKTTGLSLKEVKFVNGTTRVPFDYKVKFTGKLREYQEKPFEDLFDELCGVFKAPPRSGKTVIGTAGACHSGFRTVIMADQKDFLDGFLETIEQMTNLPHLEEKYGKKLYGFPKTLADYKNFQIILVTYQSLIGNNKTAKKRLKLLNENYGTLFVDECFTRGHRVLTELGLVDIADIVDGIVSPQTVLSKNLETGEKEMRRIESRTVKKTKKLCRVHVGDQVITCTPTHLFWSNTRNDYVEAQHLTEEDDLDLTKSTT